MMTIPGTSDHHIVKATIHMDATRVYSYRRADWAGLRDASRQAEFSVEYAHSDHENRSVHENWDILKYAISQAVNKYIPQKILCGSWNLPWVSTKIKRDLQRKQRASNKFRKINNERDWKHSRQPGSPQKVSWLGHTTATAWGPVWQETKAILVLY